MNACLCLFESLFVNISVRNFGVRASVYVI